MIVLLPWLIEPGKYAIFLNIMHRGSEADKHGYSKTCFNE